MNINLKYEPEKGFNNTNFDLTTGEDTIIMLDK